MFTSYPKLFLETEIFSFFLCLGLVSKRMSVKTCKLLTLGNKNDIKSVINLVVNWKIGEE